MIIAAVTYWLKQHWDLWPPYYDTFAAHRMSSLRVQQHLAFNVTNVEFLFRSHLVPLGSHFSNAPITHLATHITTWWTCYSCFAPLHVQERPAGKSYSVSRTSSESHHFSLSYSCHNASHWPTWKLSHHVFLYWLGSPPIFSLHCSKLKGHSFKNIKPTTLSPDGNTPPPPCFHSLVVFILRCRILTKTQKTSFCLVL